MLRLNLLSGRQPDTEVRYPRGQKMWKKIIKRLAKYGKRAVNYAWKHKGYVLKLAKDLGIYAAVDWVLDKLGIK